MKIGLPLEIKRKENEHYMYMNSHTATAFNPFHIKYLFTMPFNFLKSIVSIGSAQFFAYDFVKYSITEEDDGSILPNFSSKNIRELKGLKAFIDEKDHLIFGNPVLACADGEVVMEFNYQKDDYNSILHLLWNKILPNALTNFTALGNFIIIKHDDFTYSTYAHLKNNSIKVKRGDKVDRGQKIAEIGNTGESVTSHLHFAITAFPVPYTAYNIPRQADYENIYVANYSDNQNKIFDFAKMATFTMLLNIKFPIKYKKHTGPFPNLYGFVSDKQ